MKRMRQIWLTGLVLLSLSAEVVHEQCRRAGFDS